MTRTEDYQQIEVSSPEDLADWLEANHGQAQSVWLVTFKKDAAPEKFVSREQVLDLLVAFGWIDGVRRKLDDDRTMQLISPRKTQYWAKSYKDRAARLIDEGAMRPPGLASIEAGKRSGLWSFMDDVDALIVPDDLRAALDSRAQATTFFDGAAPSYRRNVLRWLKLAKTQATRDKRIGQIVSLSASGQKVPQM